MKLRLLVLLPALLCAGSLFAYQDAPATSAGAGHQPQSLANENANEKLGTVDFPISCAASQQKAFERGVALLRG